MRPSADGILESAERVFAKRGFGNTTLRQLMAGAGVSTTAFYARFSSKEAVLDELVSRLVTSMTENALARLSQATSLEKGFDAGIEVLLETITSRRALVGLMMREAPTSLASRETLRRSYAGLASLLATMLEPLLRKNGIPPAGAQSLGWALVGALKIQIERWVVFEDIGDGELEEALRSTARALMPLLRRPKPMNETRSSADAGTEKASSKDRGRRSSDE